MRQRPAWTFPERWLPMADITSSRAFAPAPPWRLIAVALVVIAMLVAALVYVGAQERRVPAPFGPAANGLIPYDKGGDIYVGDPVAGTSRLVVGGPERDTSPGYSPDGTLIAFFRVARTGSSPSCTPCAPTAPTSGRVTAAPPDRSRGQFGRRTAGISRSSTRSDGHKRLDVFDMDGKAVSIWPATTTSRRSPSGRRSGRRSCSAA